jgi:hypothetical protein
MPRICKDRNRMPCKCKDRIRMPRICKDRIRIFHIALIWDAKTVRGKPEGVCDKAKRGF